jgi:hypothetical protein
MARSLSGHHGCANMWSALGFLPSGLVHGDDPIRHLIA